jgi:hypothetical protein
VARDRKENEVGGTCSTHEKSEKCKKVLFGKHVGSGQLGDLGIDERIILKCNLKK